MKQSQERLLKGLTEIYEDCIKNGSITNMSMYTKTYGLNQSTGTVLVEINRMKKEGFGRNASYTWNGRKPDQEMVLEVSDALNNYIQRWKNPAPKKNLVPISEVKERLRTEVTAEVKAQMEAEIYNKMMRAANAAREIGIDLLKLPPEKVKRFANYF